MNCGRIDHQLLPLFNWRRCVGAGVEGEQQRARIHQLVAPPRTTRRSLAPTTASKSFHLPKVSISAGAGAKFDPRELPNAAFLSPSNNSCPPVLG